MGWGVQNVGSNECLDLDTTGSAGLLGRPVSLAPCVGGHWQEWHLYVNVNELQSRADTSMCAQLEMVSRMPTAHRCLSISAEILSLILIGSSSRTTCTPRH